MLMLGLLVESERAAFLALYVSVVLLFFLALLLSPVVPLPMPKPIKRMIVCA